MWRALSILVSIGSWLLFGLAIAWPVAALLADIAGSSLVPTDGFVLSERQWQLFVRSLVIAAAAATGSVLLAMPGAFAIGRGRRLLDRPFLVAGMLAVLISPPMVYAFGWASVWPTGLDPRVQSVLVWALWLWPIPALVLGAGWLRLGSTLYESAILNMSPAAAFVFVVLPVLGRHILFVMLLVFILCLNDYGVPHACGLVVMATELLGLALSSTRAIDTLWPALPGVVTTLSVLVFLCVISKRMFLWGVHSPTSAGGPRDSGWVPPDWSTVATVMLVVFSWAVPLGVLVVRSATPEAMTVAIRTYGGDLAWSMWTAGLSGVLIVFMGLGIVRQRLGSIAVVVAIAFGTLPGALVGATLVVAYNHDLTAPLYDDWPIIVICYMARFGWMGLAAIWLMMRGERYDTIQQACIDGANDFAVWVRIQLPMHWPVLAATAGVTAVMALAEVPASTLVRVPRFGSISQVLIEKFHRFEDGLLVSLCLWLIAAALLAVALGVVGFRRSGVSE